MRINTEKIINKSETRNIIKTEQDNHAPVSEELSDKTIKSFSKAISSAFCAFIGIQQKSKQQEMMEAETKRKADEIQKQQEAEKQKGLIVEQIRAKCNVLCIDEEIIDKLIKSFDFENAEAHLANLERVLNNHFPRLPKAIENGYFSSKQGAEAINFVFDIIGKNIDFLLKNAKYTDILEIKAKNFHEIFDSVPKMLSALKLQQEEVKRMSKSKYSEILDYVSHTEEVNKILVKIKKEYKNITIEELRYLDQLFTDKIKKEQEKEPQIIKILEKLAKDFNSDLSAINLILLEENIDKFEAYKKAYKYLEKQNKLNAHIIMGCNTTIEDILKKSKNGDIFIFDKNGNFLKSSTSVNKFGDGFVNKFGHVFETSETMSGVELFESHSENSIVTDMKTEFYDKDKNLKYTEIYEKVSDLPNKFNIIRKFPDGSTKQLGFVEKTPSGNYMFEKIIQTDNNNAIQHLYIETPDKSTLIKTKFVNADKSSTVEHNYKFKVINENLFETIENGTKYTVDYSNPDEVVVTKDNGDSVSLAIGDNLDKSPLSDQLFPMLQYMPGSFYFLIPKYGLTKIGKEINGVAQDCAHFSPSKNLIAISKEKRDSLFTLAHEFGHYIFNNISEQEQSELSKIFEKELNKFLLTKPINQLDIMSHLLKQTTEMFAEVCALMFTSNNVPHIEIREQLLQEFFPETYKSMMKCIQKYLYS